MAATTTDSDAANLVVLMRGVVLVTSSWVL
jgi:hypothetical protein